MSTFQEIGGGNLDVGLRENVVMKILVLLSVLILAACARHVAWQSTITIEIVEAAPAVARDKEVVLLFLRSAAFHDDLDAQDHSLWGAISQIEFLPARRSPAMDVRFTATSRETALKAGKLFAKAAVDFAKQEQAPASAATVKLRKVPTIVDER
jgi:hypothetical protein